MKLVVDLPDTLVGRIKEAVESGGYEDSREFVTTAIENQLEIEEDGETTFVTLEEAVAEYDRNEESRESNQGEKSEETMTDGLGRRTYDAVPTVSPPDEERLDTGPLWGQYNRIFPIKLVVRRLANAVQKANSEGRKERNPRTDVSWIDLQQFSDETSTKARNYGLAVKEADERRGRGRGEKLSAGLPTGEDAEKSTDRFETHFVGYSDRNGNLTGAPSALHFVDITDEEVSRIGITNAGLEFAELSNPLLDSGPDADESLSSEERDFYLEHVREELPAEFGAMHTTALAISEGDDRPESLSERVAEFDSDWSKAQASTVRSGLVSRMHELGLVDRKRVGQRGIAYELTESGRRFRDQSDAEVTSR